MPFAKRVHEIAEELGMTNAEVIDLCGKLGIGVKGPSSTVIDSQANRIRARAKESSMRDSRSKKVQYSPVRDSQTESVLATKIRLKKVNANLIIFDLDGTLANTKSLNSGRREPWQIIDPGVNSSGHSLFLKNWDFGNQVTETPARLIERGHVVIIATSSPLAYASTLLHILGIDYHDLFPSCGAGVAKSTTLTKICDAYKFERTDAAYVGDLPVDADCAHAAGMGFISASELHSSSSPENLFALSSFKMASFSAANSDDALRQIRARLEKMRIERRGLFNNAWYEPFRTFSDLSDFCDAAAFGVSQPTLKTLLFRLKDPVITVNNFVKMGKIDSGETHSFERTLLELDGMQQMGLTYDDQIRHYIVTLWFLGLRYRLVRDPNVRRRIQLCLFKNLTENDGQQLICFSDGFLGLSPSVITRRELRSDEDLRGEYLSALKRVWPNLVGSGGGRLQGVFDYQTDSLGKVLLKLKDYGRKPGAGNRFRGGPEVRLSYLDFVSDLVASRFDLTQNYPIVPVPTTVQSNLQPGQVSIRLARLVADAVGREVVPLLQRDGDMLSLNEQESKKLSIGETVDLVEDQITTGGTIGRCQRLLHEAGFIVNHCYAYSGHSNHWIKTHERPKLGFKDWWDELSSFFLSDDIHIGA